MGWNDFLGRLQPGQAFEVEEHNSDDLMVLDSGAEFDGQHLDYLWFHLEEREAGRTYRTYKAIKLRMLTYMPIEARDDPNILGKMVTVLRGLYNAQVDFVHLHAGIFQEPALGIVQVYGVVGISEKRLYDALNKTEEGVAALLAAMANYPQSRLSRLDIRKARWILDAMQGMPYALSVVGQPRIGLEQSLQALEHGYLLGQIRMGFADNHGCALPGTRRRFPHV